MIIGPPALNLRQKALEQSEAAPEPDNLASVRERIEAQLDEPPPSNPPDGGIFSCLNRLLKCLTQKNLSFLLFA